MKMLKALLFPFVAIAFVGLLWIFVLLATALVAVSNHHLTLFDASAVQDIAIVAAGSFFGGLGVAMVVGLVLWVVSDGDESKVVQPVANEGFAEDQG